MIFNYSFTKMSTPYNMNNMKNYSIGRNGTRSWNNDVNHIEDGPTIF